MVGIRYIAILFFGINVALCQDYSVTKLVTPLSTSAYSPAFYKNHLVICSHQKDRIYKTVYDQKGLEPSDLYLINLKNSDSCERFDEKFRTNYNDGPIAFDATGNLAIVSRNLIVSDKVNSIANLNNQLGLFWTVYSNEKGWSDLMLLPFIDSLYTYTHPTLNRAGDVLIFTSNKPGGYGGFDLWMSKLEDNNWTEPENLGERINSKNDELFPTLNKTELYFSSNTIKENGLDIYTVSLENNTTIPTRLPEPFNSNYDDFGAISKDNGKSGYFSSNRNGYDQVYEFLWHFPEFENCEPQVNDVFCYTLYEENSTDLNEMPALVYEWDINGIKVIGHPIDYCFPGKGDYTINLNIIDTIVNQVYTNIATYNINLNYTEQPFIYSKDTMELNKTYYFDAANTYLPALSTISYYWKIEDLIELEGNVLEYTFSDTGSYEIILGAVGVSNNESRSYCVSKTVFVTDKVFNNNGLPKIEENDNLTVSSIVQSYRTSSDTAIAYYSVEVFTTDKIIDTNYFVYKVLSKDYSTRLEFDEVQQKYRILVGEYGNIEEAYGAWFELQSQGYYDAVIKTFLIENFNNIVFNDVFVLEQMNFSANSAKLKPSATDDLDDLVTIMNKFPTLVLEISAHTDSQGNDDFNLKLSEERGKSIQREMINKGIDSERLIVKGYGESKPIDSNETEEGRQKNRRVEFLLHQP